MGIEDVKNSGSGYYNYYNVASRLKTDKPKTAWYDRDLSKEDISSNNTTLNSEYEGADVCRKIASLYKSTAEANRIRYTTAEELKSAVYAKYNQKSYSRYSIEERFAMARNEINMTMYGIVDLYDVNHDPHLNGEVTKNTLGRSEENNRAFNVDMLGKQINNVFAGRGIDTLLMGNRRFMFSISGSTKEVEISILDDDDVSPADTRLIEEMTKALNSGENGKKLFYNLLSDSNKQGILRKDSLAKYRLYSEFQNITGLSLDDFRQTERGLVNKENKQASDIYKEALKSSNKVPSAFKGVAYDYFKMMENDVLKYDISKIPDLNVSMEYQNGKVMLNGMSGQFDFLA